MSIHDRDVTRFAEKGLLHLRKLIPKAVLDRTKEFIFTELKRSGVYRDNRWHTKKYHDLPPFQFASKISSCVAMYSAPVEVFTSDIATIACTLASVKLNDSQPCQALITPPQNIPWMVPALGWHLDVSAPSISRLPGVQVFVLLDDVASSGGATCVVTGSHRLHPLKHGSKESAHHALRADPKCCDLFNDSALGRNDLLKPQIVRDVEVQVVELSGSSGDVYFMDMRLLHAPSINSSKKPRLVLTKRYLQVR